MRKSKEPQKCSNYDNCGSLEQTLKPDYFMRKSNCQEILNNKILFLKHKKIFSQVPVNDRKLVLALAYHRNNCRLTENCGRVY